MSMVAAGPNSILWSKHQDTFPYVEGMVPILLSWFVSPIMAGTVSVILFGFVRTVVLRSKHAYERSFYVRAIR
jgi:solute carrier family 20 (sodium-dependent phosphate transporter)